MYVVGSSLNGVGDPKLEITMVHTITGSSGSDVTDVFESECTKQSNSKMTCQYPELDIPQQFLDTQKDGDIAFDKDTEKEKKSHGADFQVKIEGESLDFYLGFHLDGDKSYTNLTESLPEQSVLKIYKAQPTFDKFQDIKMHEPEMQLRITGKKMNYVLDITDYKVKIGKDLCSVLSLNENELICHPPDEEPTGSIDGTHPITVLPGTTLGEYFIGMYAHATHRIGPKVFICHLHLCLLV